MNREEKIEAIRTIINEFGSFSTAEVEASCSPCLQSFGKDTHILAERFYKDNVEAVTYVHETETNSSDILYEDLSDEVLDEILPLAQEWETMQLSNLGGE